MCSSLLEVGLLSQLSDLYKLREALTGLQRGFDSLQDGLQLAALLGELRDGLEEIRTRLAPLLNELSLLVVLLWARSQPSDCGKGSHTRQ